MYKVQENTQTDPEKYVKKLTHVVAHQEDPLETTLGRTLVYVFEGDVLEFSAALLKAAEGDSISPEILPVHEINQRILSEAEKLLSKI